jgi:hypothetical protein
VEQGLLFVALVAAAAGIRCGLQAIPNFAPVAAVALFAGFCFPSRWLALLVPLSAMWISDYFIGGYQVWLMATVYAALAMPVLMRSWLRRQWQEAAGWRGAVRVTLATATCSLAASLLFFAATNLVTWMVTPWYPRSLAGIGQCYIAAVPFFRYTLLGDLTFATILFGGYALARQWRTAPVGARPATS